MFRPLTFLCIAFLTGVAAAAKVETFNVWPSPGLPTSGDVVAIVPEVYDGSTAFPAFLLLHGATDDCRTWMKNGGDLRALADKHGRIILCPSAGPVSWYNTRNGSEQYLVEMVLPAAAQRYKLSGDCWIGGNSMGGYGALRLFANHPKKFSAVLALSPGTKPSRWAPQFGISEAFGPFAKSGIDDTFTDVWMKKLPKDSRPIVMVCGDRDFFLKDFNECLDAAKKFGLPVISEPVQGDHSWEFWSRELPRALVKLPPTTGKR
jgi:S-formylglutathione hydrolase FrmB